MKKLLIIFVLLLVPFCLFIRFTSPTEADYTIQIIKGTVWANPRANTTHPSFHGSDVGAVVNSVIGVLGDSGSIHITTGAYTQSTTITVAGKGSLPYTQLKIFGDGMGATALSTNVPGVNNFLIKNNANIMLADMRLYAGNLANSNILADTTGASSECSMQLSTFSNLFCGNSSASHPSVWLKDFFTLAIVGTFKANADSNTAMIVENHSHSGTFYGNSVWDDLILSGSSTYPNAGIIFRSTDHGSTQMDHIHIGMIYVYGGYFGALYGDCNDISAAGYDIEVPVHNPIVIGANYPNDSTYAGCYGNSFGPGGAILINAGDTAIIAGPHAQGNKFINLNLYPNDTTTALIVDQNNGGMANSYDLDLFYAGKPVVSFTNPANVWFSYRRYNGQSGLTLPSQTSGQTTLSSGVKTISIQYLTSTSRAFVQQQIEGGASATVQYSAVCTAGTLTITALQSSGSVNTSDNSTLYYFVIY